MLPDSDLDHTCPGFPAMLSRPRHAGLHRARGTCAHAGRIRRFPWCYNPRSTDAPGIRLLALIVNHASD